MTYSLRWGTNHFIDMNAAIKYYRSQQYDHAAIMQKYEENEFKIGKPEVKEGEQLLINKEEGRYFITTKGGE